MKNTWLTSKNCLKITKLNNVRCNCYLVRDNDNVILIDTSIKSERNLILNAIQRNDVKNLTAIVQTHNHFDHAGNTEFLKTYFKCKVFIHRNDSEGLKKGFTKLPEGIKGLMHLVTRKINNRNIMLPFQKYEPCTEVEVFDDNFDLLKYGIHAKIIHTPGHTSGSASIIVDDEIALVGDAMVRGINNEMFPPFADYKDKVLESWEKLLNTGCKFFLPAHGSQNSCEEVLSELNKHKREDINEN